MRTKIILIFMMFSLSFGSVPKDSMITYIFIGHSNMLGYCSELDSIIPKNVWLYKSGTGFYHGVDRGTSSMYGSPMTSFLKRMAILYPQYNFCGIKCTNSGSTFEAFYNSDLKVQLYKKLSEALDSSIFGGCLAMFGFAEGKDSAQVKDMDRWVNGFSNELSIKTGYKNIPFIFGRYEKNGRKVLSDVYHKYDSLTEKKIESFEKLSPYFKVSPIRYVPKEDYCDDHHYNRSGYEIWANDAAAIIQQNNFDFWYKDAN
jgi:hypothetical protein